MKYSYLRRPTAAVIAVNLIAFFAAIGFLFAVYAVEFNAYKNAVNLTEQQMWQLRITDVLLCFIMMVAGQLTDSLSHECGHALFGLISGMRAKISFKSCLPASGVSSVQIIPKKEDKTRLRLAITLCGGLFVNALFIVLGILAVCIKPIPIWLAGLAVTHIWMFIKNAAPVEYSTGKADGLALFELIKNTPQSQVMLAVLKVQAHVLGGKPIADCRDDLFTLPQIREDDPAFISLTELRAIYYEAIGEADAAAEQYARFTQLKLDYLD